METVIQVLLVLGMVGAAVSVVLALIATARWASRST